LFVRTTVKGAQAAIRACCLLAVSLVGLNGGQGLCADEPGADPGPSR
jgi:hypothetical protein